MKCQSVVVVGHTLSLAFMCGIDTMFRFEERFEIFIKLHLLVFLLLKVSNIFHYWPLCDFDRI